MELELFFCRHCGNLIVKMNNSGVDMVCCGENMQRLLPNVNSASAEKHLPVVKKEGNTITASVGQIEHPMTEEHYIMWIILVSPDGILMHKLMPGDKPTWVFPNTVKKDISVYSYCNLHGLWKIDLTIN